MTSFDMHIVVCMSVHVTYIGVHLHKRHIKGATESGKESARERTPNQTHTQRAIVGAVVAIRGGRETN